LATEKRKEKEKSHSVFLDTCFMLAAKPSISPKRTIINTATEIYKVRVEHIMRINGLNAG